LKVFALGGSSSIGLAIIKAYVRSGHDVVATYNSIEPADAGGATWMKANLRSGLPGLAAAATGADVALLLPGVVFGKALSDYTDEMIAEIIDVNFAGQVRVIREITPVLANDSQVIIMGSLAAQRGSADPMYGATKGAMHALAKALSKSLAPKTRVNVVAPGMVSDTQMYDATPQVTIESHLGVTPTKHFISAAQLAEIVVDISKPHWSQLNGATIDLNGAQYVR
jgi:3-oxoacyl-[acyl-carrier protein] reductase